MCIEGARAQAKHSSTLMLKPPHGTIRRCLWLSLFLLTHASRNVIVALEEQYHQVHPFDGISVRRNRATEGKSLAQLHKKKSPFTPAAHLKK